MFTTATALLYTLCTIVNIMILYNIEKKLVILSCCFYKNKVFFNFYGSASWDRYTFSESPFIWLIGNWILFNHCFTAFHFELPHAQAMLWRHSWDISRLDDSCGFRGFVVFYVHAAGRPWSLSVGRIRRSLCHTLPEYCPNILVTFHQCKTPSWHNLSQGR